MLKMGTAIIFAWLTLANSVWGQLQPSQSQLEEFKNSTNGPVGILTLPNGAPVNIQDAYESLNSNLIFQRHFLEGISALDRERVPPRVNHAKGVAAIGYLEVTHDVTNITNAALFSKVGKKTRCVVRFSQAFAELGSPDTARGALGFAAKFYTEEGNWDFLGLSPDTFFFKDPLRFVNAQHVGLRNPKTNMPDTNAFLDFFLSIDDAVNFLLQFFGDPGIHESYRYAPSHAYHAFQVENDNQSISLIRVLVTPDAGVKYMNDSRATTLRGTNPDYYIADLYNSIATGDYPTWTLGMQVIPLKEVGALDFDLFDVTLRWPLDKYPIQPIGKVILNEWPDNQFKYQEQIALCPSNLVPGIQGADGTFQARIIAYRDTQRYRMGANVDKIEVNRPLSPTFTYNRDGRAPVRDNYGSIPNYFPNSFNGPVPVNETRTRTKRVRPYTDPRAMNLGPATDYYNGLTDDHKQRIIDNIVGFMSRTYAYIQQRGIKYFGRVSKELGDGIRVGLAAAK